MQIDELQAVFRCCPCCGAEQVVISGDHRIYCSACGFEYFHNVATAVGALILTREGLLLLERAKDPARGKLALPGGFVDPGESLEEALSRECMEEIGWKAELHRMEYLCSFPNTYRYKDILYHTCDMFFLFRQDSLDITMLYSDPTEVTSLSLIPLEKLQLEDLAFESTRKVIELLIKTY
ncbi:NUDIX hydrolase [Gracilinema caldarium]|uniref:NUDIX hydrolase n=1 Tax=Gracilinema caldarium (strain ATCC 51460 / DSM 7334 / H1) TaxID=744872 RepID=F8EWN9_GRAC1|nr:NUDIX domain-containing protein [Gracilinema caldarium]AEJ18202.1 NUDIX hydrolase [Gracilinema caldarium DSM 7334]